MKQQFDIGEAVKTTVVQVAGDTIFIDIGQKSEGIVDAAEFTEDDGTISVKAGDTITAYFAGDQRGELRFTTRIGGNDADDTMLEKAYRAGLPVQGTVEKEIKGGFEVKLGTARAFCPYSQMGFRTREEPAAFVGRSLTFLITEYKNDGKDLIVSNRRIGEQAERQNIDALAQTVTVGTKVTGTVQSLQSYGAFIDIGGFRVLLPVSEISHERVKDVADVLSIGQTVEAVVIKADWQHEKVSVSMKSLEKDPWDDVAATIVPGAKIDGTIARVAPFGLFVTLAKGIDGLVHSSALEGVSASTNLTKKFKAGDPFSVVVEKIDAKERRISLLPAASADQEQSAAAYLSHQNDDGEHYNPFAALLKK